MIARLRELLVLLVAAGTVLVAAGVGQGAPPRQPPLSARAQAREIRALVHAGPQVRRGERLFAAHGCDACHTIAAGGYGGRLGPRLDVQSPGTSSGEIESSIVDPPHSVPGYEAGLMPEDFARRLPHRDIQALAAFIATAGRAANRG
jgi:mono/diheme cytochrome c family protein